MNQVELDIVKASVNYPIIANMERESFEVQIRTTINRIAAMYGIKELPDDWNMNILMQFIVDYYQRFTVQELLKAAETNLTDPPDARISPYGAITVDFITRLMERYREKKIIAVKAYNQAKLKTVEPTFDRETPEQALRGLVDFYKRENAVPAGWNWSSCFDALYASGQAGSVETLREWFEITSKQVTGEIKARVATASNLIEKRQLELQLQESNLKYEARKRFVQNWLVNNQHD